MDSVARPLRRQSERHIVTWDRQFEKRQQQTYETEDAKVERVTGQSRIAAFFAQQETPLDPSDYLYTALREYLDHVSEDVFEQEPSSSQHNPRLALINDRRDTTGWHDGGGFLHFERDWEVYERYPPPGENQYFKLLDAGRFYRRLREDVSISFTQEMHTDCT